MADAPFCNVEIAKNDPRLQPKPTSPKGVQLIPPRASLQQMTTIINNNFNQLIKGNFVEERGSRQVLLTRIFDPSNHNVWVDVRQIIGVKFINPLTGQTITWNRGPAETGQTPTGDASFGGGGGL